MTDRYQKYKGLKLDWPENGILRVTIENPGKLNAASAAIHAEFADIWCDIDRDPSVRVVLVRGAGNAFCAGGDLDIVEEMTEDFGALITVWKEAKDLVQNLVNCTKPIVSAIEGPAIGAGLAVALLADISVASKTANLIDGHTKLGVAAGDHAAIIWPLLCGMAKAKYYLMLCERLTGEEAERIGLVSLCTEPEELHDTAMEIAKKLAAGSPTAIRWTKHALNGWLRSAAPTFDASLALEMLGFRGPDVKEGIKAVREKRRPVFEP
ncbi:MAG: enoyl-CoA hydratase/isomerase family protein [Rhodospirillales bacterium]|jgi:enoyl-CoA hydratase